MAESYRNEVLKKVDAVPNDGRPETEPRKKIVAPPRRCQDPVCSCVYRTEPLSREGSHVTDVVAQHRPMARNTLQPARKAEEESRTGKLGFVAQGSLMPRQRSIDR